MTAAQPVTARRIVLDANILIRAVLGVRVRKLIERYGQNVELYAPELAFTEAVRHLPAIAAKRGASAAALLKVVRLLRGVVEPVSEDITAPLEHAALARIGGRDPMDWPIVAAALALDCPIWTEDKDFFGSGIATWTSDRVEIYLRQQ